jgi:hypothetical protein
VTSLIVVSGDERFGEVCYVHLQVTEQFPPQKSYSELLTASFHRTLLISITVLICLLVSLFQSKLGQKLPNIQSGPKVGIQ